jgi:DNA-binding GntR family transcriptional regulator
LSSTSSAAGYWRSRLPGLPPAGQITQLADHLVAIESVAERARTNPAGERLLIDAEHAFRNTVLAAAGNRVLARMAAPVEHVLSTLSGPATPEDRFERSIADHGHIQAAIADRDPEAARAATGIHLRRVEMTLRVDTHRGDANASRSAGD